MCSGSNSFGFVLDQFVLVFFLAIAYTAFQMTLGSLPWATPRSRFLIAQCFRLPLLPRFASMMARTFNDVYCTSQKEPGLGRTTLPIIEWIFFTSVFQKSTIGFLFMVFCVCFFSFSFCVWVCPSGFSSLFVCLLFSVFFCTCVSYSIAFFKSFNFSESARVLYRRN